MSRSPSPMNTPSPVYSETSESEAAEEEEEKGEEDTATCLWGECGKVFTHLPSLIEHIHVDHVGVNKSNYFCDWATCNRRGIAQTSRFALTSHLRSHTKEKPFVCPLPECDKSFTRSDALAKHLRHQHKQSPPAPGRGGSRKRKRHPDDIEVAPSVSTRSQTPTLGTFSLFDLPALSEVGGEDDEGYRSSGSGSDVIPPHLMVHLEPGTGRIFGRSPEQVLYLLMKAKLRYAREQNEALQEELRVTRAEMRREREGKERAVNHVLRGLFGGKADDFLVLTEERPEYDRGVNTFSPEGRLFQVEYAIEAIKLGSTTIGVRTPEGVVLGVEQRVQSPLLEASSIEKIMEIDQHVGCAMSGLTADARTMIDHARVTAQNHAFTYDERIKVESVTQAVCDLALRFGESVHDEEAMMSRPFGVALLVAGHDELGPQLYHTDPSGTSVRYEAKAIGSGSEAAQSELQDKWHKQMTLQEARTLTLRVLKQVMEEKLDHHNVQLAQVTPANGFEVLDEAALKSAIELM